MLKRGLTVLRLDAQLKRAHRERLYVYEIQFQIRLWLYSEDVKKCESILTTLNDTLKAADDLLSSIETKRKTLYKEGHSCRTSQLQTERAASGATARTAAGIKQVNND